MINKLFIDNFKGLNDFEITFYPLTVLIGDNSTGKTSVLQVVELLSNFFNNDINEYFKNKSLLSSGLKSKLNKKKYITFRIEISLQNELNDIIIWELKLVTDIYQRLAVAEEFISKKDTNSVDTKLLKRTKNGLEIYNDITAKKEIKSEIPIKSNATAINNLIENKEKYEKRFPIFLN